MPNSSCNKCKAIKYFHLVKDGKMSKNAAIKKIEELKIIDRNNLYIYNEIIIKVKKI